MKNLVFSRFQKNMLSKNTFEIHIWTEISCSFQRRWSRLTKMNSFGVVSKIHVFFIKIWHFSSKLPCHWATLASRAEEKYVV